MEISNSYQQVDPYSSDGGHGGHENYSSFDNSGGPGVSTKRKAIVAFILTVLLITMFVVLTQLSDDDEPVVEQSVLTYYSMESYAPTAVCNDGSPAGLYVRKSKTGNQGWVILLQGGAYCFDEQSCDDRLVTLASKTTSVGIAAEEVGYGILSDDSASNARYYDYNHVDFSYCSSDLWSGNTTAADNDVEINGETWNWLGMHILEKGLHFLADEHGMDVADEIVMAGRTSGGVGNLVTLPHSIPWLTEVAPDAQLSALIDSGWVVDFPVYNESALTCANVDTCSVVQGVELAHDMWNPPLHEDCLAKYGDEYWKCYQGLYAYEFIPVPVLIIENQDDPVQVTNLGDPDPETEEEIAYAITVAAHVVEEVTSVADQYFMAACNIHGILDQAYWTDIVIVEEDGSETNVPAGIAAFDAGAGSCQLYDECGAEEWACGMCPDV